MTKTKTKTSTKTTTKMSTETKTETKTEIEPETETECVCRDNKEPTHKDTHTHACTNKDVTHTHTTCKNTFRQTKGSRQADPVCIETNKEATTGADRHKQEDTHT